MGPRHRSPPSTRSLALSFALGAAVVFVLMRLCGGGSMPSFSPASLLRGHAALFDGVRESAGLVARAVSKGQRTALEPSGVIIAWGGVPTLVFRGFTPSLLRVKAELERTFPGIATEHGGSMFAKTSLGALCEGPACTLSVAELEALRAVCKRMAPLIRHDRRRPSSWLLRVPALHLSLYGDRAQQASTRIATIPLGFGAAPRLEHASSEASAHARDVARPFLDGDLAEYHPKVANGHRIQHYMAPFQGASLVAFWPCYDGRDAARARGAECAPQWLARLRREFDAAAPGKFQWFDDGDLHVTLRGLFQLSSSPQDLEV